MKKLQINSTDGGPARSILVKNFSGGMARTLAMLCRRYETTNTWVNAKQAALSPGDLTKLAMWGFVQQQAPQGRQKKSGLWSPTAEGWNFAKGQTSTSTALLIEGVVSVGFVEKFAGVQDFIKAEELQRIWSS